MIDVLDVAVMGGIVLVVIYYIVTRRGYFVKMTFDGDTIVSKPKRKITRNSMDIYMDYNKREISIWLNNGYENETKSKLEEFRKLIDQSE